MNKKKLPSHMSLADEIMLYGRKKNVITKRGCALYFAKRSEFEAFEKANASALLKGDINEISRTMSRLKELKRDVDMTFERACDDFNTIMSLDPIDRFFVRLRYFLGGK